MMTLAFIFPSHSTFPAASSVCQQRGDLSQRSIPLLFGSTKEIYLHSEVFGQLWLLPEHSGIIYSNQHRVIIFRNTKQGS